MAQLPGAFVSTVGSSSTEGTRTSATTASGPVTYNFFGVQNVFNLGGPGNYEISINQGVRRSVVDSHWSSFQQQEERTVSSSSAPVIWMTPPVLGQAPPQPSANQPSQGQELASRNRICPYCIWFVTSDKGKYINHLVEAHRDLVNTAEAVDIAENEFSRLTSTGGHSG